MRCVAGVRVALSLLRLRRRRTGRGSDVLGAVVAGLCVAAVVVAGLCLAAVVVAGLCLAAVVVVRGRGGCSGMVGRGNRRTGEGRTADGEAGGEDDDANLEHLCSFDRWVMYKEPRGRPVGAAMR